MRFVFADHTLDTDRRELCRGGTPIAVEPQVFDLLTYLVQNRERVVSKDDLFASVWGGRIVADSTLASRINAARKAIGDAVDIKQPQAVMYEPMPDGKMELVAVEYIASKGPASLEGHLFNFNGAPNRYGLGPFYELHVWAWKANPHGAFADMNPNVSCDHASMK